MGTVSQRISVELPEVKDFAIKHIIRCGDSEVEILLYDWVHELWRPTDAHIEAMNRTPRPFEMVLEDAKEHALRLETARLMHLKLGSVLEEI